MVCGMNLINYYSLCSFFFKHEKEILLFHQQVFFSVSVRVLKYAFLNKQKGQNCCYAFSFKNKILVL